MHGIGKKAAPQESGRSFPMPDNDSMLIASLKLRKGRKISRSNNHKPQSSFRLKIGGSTPSKTTVTDSSCKGTRNDSANRKLIHKRLLHKAFEKKRSKKKDSSELLGKRSSIAHSDGIGKNANEDVPIKKLKKRKNKRRKKDEAKLDEASRLQRRARYLLIKMKLEQNLIDAYSGEGWKGQSREKIKPEKELLRAKKQILKCKLGIRDAIRQLDSLSSVGCIEESAMAPDGSVSHEHIFCAKCKSNEVSPDNDIVLCDGTCNCAFHQKCLDPPLDTENIPPGDQGWFCKFCECRMEIIEAMNAHLGTHFSVDGNWQEIFEVEAALPDGDIWLNPEEEWPSDDSEDVDYDPDRRENNMSGAGTDDDLSHDISSSTSLLWSSDGEPFSGSRRWEVEGLDMRNQTIYSCLDSDKTSDGEIMCGRRRRQAVDYKKLYDEMFGKDASAHDQVSEDEDWGPGKRKRREKESDAASTLMTLYASEEKSEKVETMKPDHELPEYPITRRPIFRIPPHAVEKLRKVFAENELPSRTVKENLSKELGLEPVKVSKWFKNARYLALKSRKAGTPKQLRNSSPSILEEPRLDGTSNGKGTSTETIPSLKNLKRELEKTNPKKIYSGMKNVHRSTPLGSPAKSKETRVESGGYDMSLKKLLKAKTNRGKKREDSISEKACQVAEAEMERLLRAKVRLENMKQRLLIFQDGNGRKSNRNHMLEESIVYVPIAELREKD